MKTIAYGGKLISDLKSALPKYTESVKKSHATANEIFFVAQCNVTIILTFLISIKKLQSFAF